MIHSKAIQMRLNCFRAIFGNLAGRDFGVQDVASTIKMTHSGTRRYRRELLDLGLMQQTGLGLGGCAIYRLTDDQADIDAFMQLVADGEALPVLPTKRRPVPVAPAPVVLKPFRHWMDIALFGPAPGARGAA